MVPSAGRRTIMRPSILLFGDSITQQAFGTSDGVVKVGWGSLLAATYQRRADVLARGYYGYNTRMALEVLPRVLPLPSAALAGDAGGGFSSSRILFCTVLFGSNDAVNAGERQHVPIEEYRENTRKIVVRTRDRLSCTPASQCPIILMTPPPVYEPAWASYKGVEVSTRQNENVRQYGEAIKQLGPELNCEVIDAWVLLGGDSDDRMGHLTDGVHLSESGNRHIYDAVMNLIRQQYPHLAPMEEDDGEGKHGKIGIPAEEKLWTEMC